MDEVLRQRVWDRAENTCEYCHIPQRFDFWPFEIDHVIAEKHHGPTTADNLALCCSYDNSHKGANISGLDSRTRKLTPLFNPRRHSWHRHFRWQGAYLIGRTPIGRVTVAVLNINDPFRVELRERLIDEGLFPPT